MAIGDPIQWVVIGIVVVAIFLWGPQKIPQLAKALGSAKREFDNATKEFQGAVSSTVQAPSTVSNVMTGDQILLDTARQLGIDTGGKTREQISQEIVSKTKPSSVIEP